MTDLELLFNQQFIDSTEILEDNEIKNKMRKEIPNLTYDEVFTFENLIWAGNECTRNVGWKSSVQIFKLNFLLRITALYHNLEKRNWDFPEYNKFKISERGKVRLIQAVYIIERVAQKALVVFYLKPLIEPKLIYDNAASQKNKGTFFAIKRFREHLRWHYARFGLEGGILICDFHDFFASIDHDILLRKLRKIIKDDDLYNITEYFVERFSKGLGLGSEVSQICAIFYPNDLDHMIKDDLSIHCYGRYMDDFYIICEDINKLKEVFELIKHKVKELKLTLNDKCQIYKFKDHTYFTYLKNKTMLADNGKIIMKITDKNIRRKKRWLKKQKELLDNEILSFWDVEQSMNIWLKYASKYKNAYNTVGNVIQVFSRIFGEEIMNTEQYKRDIKKLERKLVQIDKKLENQKTYDEVIAKQNKGLANALYNCLLLVCSEHEYAEKLKEHIDNPEFWENELGFVAGTKKLSLEEIRKEFGYDE